MEAKKEDNETYRETSKHYYVGAKTELGYTITEVYIRNDNYVIYEIK